MSDQALWLSVAGMDRAAERRAVPGTLEQALADPATRVLVTAGDRVSAAGGHLAPRAPQPGDAARMPVWLGVDPDGAAWVSVRADDAEPRLADQPFEPGATGSDALVGLRTVALDLPAWESTAASTAVTMQRWHRLHSFCPRCGAATRVEDAGWRRECPECGTQHFPRTDPVVIVGVTSADGERFLLTRGVGWAPGRFSCPAGFVDAAESLADAVRREMFEEVGLLVTDVERAAEQVWPFNGQLMCAFTARVDTEELRVDPHELADARWVTRSSLAAALVAGEMSLPDRYAAGRWLVEQWYGSELPTRA